LPVRLIYFGLPPGGDFEFTVVDQIRHMRPDVRLCPYVPLSSLDQQAGTAALLKPENYGAARRFPEQAVERLPVGRLRSQKIGGLAVFPVTYYPGDNQAEVLDSITIRVRFTGESVAAAEPVSEGVFERVLSHILLNHQSSRILRKRPEPYGILARRATEDPFSQANIWYKLRTAKEGIYRLTYAIAESLGVNPDGISDPGQIRIFYGGGKMLPASNTDTLPGFREVALLTQGFDDGRWDPGDYLEFYGQDLHRWELQPGTGKFVNVNHAFEDYNVYWFTPRAELAASPRRITEYNASLSDPMAAQIFDVEAWAHHEKNFVLRVRADGYVGDYYDWYWQNGQHIPVSMYNAADDVPGWPAELHVSTYSFGNPVSLSVNGISLDPIYQSSDGDSTVFLIDAYAGGADIQIVFRDDNADRTYLDSYDLQYRKQLKLRGGRLKFAAPDTTAAAVFSVTGVGGAGPVVWNITDPFAPVVLTGVAQEGTVARFEVDLVAGTREVFWVAEEGEVNRPLSAEPRGPAALRTPDHRADLLAVGPRQFVEAAEDYLHWRENFSALVGEKVAIEDIYDNFSYGLLDPLAIRWFLRYAFENWQAPAPQYVLLIGDGHYDLADNLNTGAASYVPPYVAADETMPSDENFIYFGEHKVLSSAPSGGNDDSYPDMIIGRWPVKSTEQVRTIADKISRYHLPATLGSWRNRIALVADDEFTGSCEYAYGNEVHIMGAEYLSAGFIPIGFEQRKIYLSEFPFGSNCRSKPEARLAILDLINEGTALIDYIGHGNPDLWAHEHVLERAADIPKMQNKDRLMVMFTASCSNGYFDDPIDEGLAEEIVRWPDGGAVAAISATRLVFANANLELNSLVFELLFEDKELSLGEALYVAKVLRQFDPTACLNPPCEQPNDRRYVLFGDPAMRFGAPRYEIVIDDVEPDTLPALGVVTVAGRVTNNTGETLTDFYGPAEFLVSDAFRERRRQITPRLRVDYDLPGGTIYHGTISVTAGEFSFGFIVPKDITYGGNTAKIIGYAVSGAVDAGGGIGRLSLGGTAPAFSDTTGPTIELYVGDRLLTDGMILSAGSVVTAVIEDTSGVNLTGEPGHAITVIFDDDPGTKTDITASFAYDPGGFRCGSVPVTMPADHPDGPMVITVKAWDNANNSSQVTVDITVSAQTEFRVLEFLNYPNPFHENTTFYFRTNGVPERAAIEVYTVGGRLIKTIDGAIDGRTAWDGTDDLGQKVANGVYLTRLTVEGHAIEAFGSHADRIAESIQKAVLWR